MASASALERYRYISDLGRGGMSHVVLAEDLLLGRRVALKRMNASGDTRALLRLRREALIGASVSHPNLVSIYDIVASRGGEYVIVMEYVDGETLRDALAGGHKLPVARVLAILDGVAAGLDAIHARGIVHRDVKPGNVLLAASGDVKLADLGIASAPERTQITADGAILGTFSYMAPEQVRGESATPATDVYALAAVAYEALSGRKARRESNPVALAHALMTQPPPDLREAWRHAPAEAAQLLRSAMAGDPGQRPQSATALTSRLRHALEPPAALPSTAPTVARKRHVARTRVEPGGTRSELVRASRAAQARRPAAPGRATSARTERPAPVNLNRPQVGSKRRRERPHAAVAIPAAQRSRRGLAGVLLALVLVAATLAVLLNRGTSHHRARAAAGATRPQPAVASTSRANHAPAPKTQVSATASAHSAQPGGSGTTPSSGARLPATAASPHSPPTTSPYTPMSAAETFYSLAAAHRYEEAWTLTDATFRAQLGGFSAFKAGQALDRSITFDSVRVLSEGADSAVLAVRTTSVRADGTQHCAGSVDLRRAASRWVLHLIHIDCA